MEAKFIGKSKLTKQGQLTLPQDGREDLSIEPESDLFWYSFNGMFVLSKELVNQKEIVELLSKKRRK